MIASFTLFFLSTMVHLIYSCLTLPKNEIVFSLLCGGVFFAAPLIFVLIGKLKRFQPYVLLTFFAASCFVLSVLNHSAFYLPVLFAAAVVLCGFFLSSKLCLYYILLTDIILIVYVTLFMPDSLYNFSSVYLLICVCYNISALGMTLFVQAVRNNLIFFKKKNKRLSVQNRQNNEFWAASAEKMNQIADRLSNTCKSMLTRTDIPVPVREKLFKIQSETGRLSIALSDAEDYALMESGALTLADEPYSFHSLVSDVASFCFASCSKPDLDIIIDCQPDIPAVLIGDRRRITQVIMTLFANSVKFTDKGSITVSFSARKTEEGVNLHIEVKDTGMGITPNAAKKIFTVYAETDGNKSSVHLGLGVAKKIVSLMGGFIFARNMREGGSRFVITLPQGVENPQPFAAVPQRDKISVLLYLKSYAVAASSRNQLDKMGIRCCICRSRADFILKKDESDITHIFFDYGFYPFDKPIFDIMARVKTVVAVCGDGETETPLPKNIKRLLKPLNMAVFSRIFNRGPADSDGFVQEFIAPDAKILAAEEAAGQLKALEAYEIKPVFTSKENIIDELQRSDYDLIILSDAWEEIAAEILCCNDGMFMHIPVISLGGNCGGCSDSLPKGFTAYELNEVLVKWLPDNLLKPIAPNPVKQSYEELNAVRGLASAGGSRSAYREMLEIFEDRAGEFLSALEKNIADKNFELCTVHLLGLQSAAANIGAVSVAETARQARAAAKRKEHGLLKELNGVLNIKLNRLLSDIALFFADNGISELTEFQIGKSAERIKEALAEKKAEIAAEMIEQVLENHIGYSARTVYKNALNEIYAKNYDKALSDLNKLKRGGHNND